MAIWLKSKLSVEVDKKVVVELLKWKLEGSLGSQRVPCMLYNSLFKSRAHTKGVVRQHASKKDS